MNIVMTKKNKKVVYKNEECVMCFYNILENESYCYCSICKIHSHLKCLEQWNEKNPNEEGVCCHCRQDDCLVKEIIPSCSCFGYHLFIRKNN